MSIVACHAEKPSYGAFWTFHILQILLFCQIGCLGYLVPAVRAAYIEERYALFCLGGFGIPVDEEAKIFREVTVIVSAKIDQYSIWGDLEKVCSTYSGPFFAGSSLRCACKELVGSEIRCKSAPYFSIHLVDSSC